MSQPDAHTPPVAVARGRKHRITFNGGTFVPEEELAAAGRALAAARRRIEKAETALAAIRELTES